MDQEKKNAIALMRYSVIAPLITGLSDDYDSLTAFFNNASAKGVILPNGKIKHYAPGTIEKWYRNYKDGGFDALIPSGRSDIGQPRKLDEDIKEQIKYLKTTTLVCLPWQSTDSYTITEASSLAMFQKQP